MKYYSKIFFILISIVQFHTAVMATNKIQNKDRIISLAPVITQTLLALQLENQIVGITKFCPTPKKMAKIKKIGDLFNLNLEMVLSLKPTLVIALKNSSQQKIIRWLKNHNIKVIEVSNNSIKNIKNMIKIIGKHTNKEKNAKHLHDKLSKNISAIKKQFSYLKSRSILMTISVTPFIVAGKNTILDDVIKLFGANNIADKSIILWPQWSLENIAKSGADIIITAATQKTLSLKNKEQISKVFIKKKPVFIECGDLFQKPGIYIDQDIKNCFQKIKIHQQ